MLGQLEGKAEIVVADFEAGLGTLSRMGPDRVDTLLVVTEPSAKSLEVARRAIDLIAGRSIGQVIVVANRVAGIEDMLAVERAFDGVPLVVVPDDPAIRAADGVGVAPFDATPDAPAVRAVRELAERLLGERPLSNQVPSS